MSELVLVIDSDPVVRGHYRAQLGVLGCRMLACDDGEIALNLVESARPDLVIVEEHVGRKRGTEILREIKTAYPDLPVFLCTDCACYQDDFASWLADACIEKTHDLAELVSEVKKRLYLIGSGQEGAGQLMSRELSNG
jgi:DNA-binding response OmpR family regulator